MVTSSGAETLPFLASFQLPASLAFFVIYGRIIDLHLPRSLTFALVVAPLLAAYAGFALFLYPAADLLHPHGFTAALAPTLPVGLHGLLKVRPLSEVIRIRAQRHCMFRSARSIAMQQVARLLCKVCEALLAHGWSHA